MPISVTCQCGKFYSLKDEFAGQLVTCPSCGVNFQVGNPQPYSQPPVVPGYGLPGAPPRYQQPVQQFTGDPAFNRNKFLLNQKMLTINEKYVVCDENGNPILYIERPAHLLRNLGAVLAGVVGGALVAAFFILLASMLPESIQFIPGVLAPVGFITVLLVLIILLQQKRHVTVYRDESKQSPLLTIFQDKKFELIAATFTIRDAQGVELARLRKNYLYNLFRKQWECYAPDGRVICKAKEDSIILSLLRRLIGPLFGILRTNFIFLQGETENVIGEFNRKFTIQDCYVLDMSADYQQTLDRRLAVAMGVMLDTGERR